MSRSHRHPAALKIVAQGLKVFLASDICSVTLIPSPAALLAAGQNGWGTSRHRTQIVRVQITGKEKRTQNSNRSQLINHSPRRGRKLRPTHTGGGRISSPRDTPYLLDSRSDPRERYKFEFCTESEPARADTSNTGVANRMTLSA